ncbi:WD40-repeat-containing domain protein [Pilobolus umbonatus]|nr:WD40-repeat-containing domain protein [Pilobolus umbonatus]
MQLFNHFHHRGKPLILFGHTARVWDCQFVDDYLVSISEDASCRVWSNSLNSGVVDEEDAECIACWEGHASKNVWSCAINADKNIVATGGQDSGIRLWSLTAIKNNKIATEDELTTFPLLNNRPNDTIRNFVIIKTQCIIAVTAEGYFIKTDLRAKSIQWEEFYYEASFKNYAIVKSDDNGRIVIAGNIHGELLIFSPLNEFKPVKIAAHTQKIFDIFIEPCATENTFNIISNGYNDSVLVHTLDLSIGHKPVLHTAFNLEMPLERTNIISIGYLPTQNVLICGSRESALIVYHLPASCAKDTIEDVKPSLQLRRSHGRQAITSVLIKDKHSMEKNIIFWTTGRDGCYIQYRLEMLTSCVKTDKKSVETELGIASRGDTITKSEDMILEKLYRNRITKGSLEGSVLVEGELVLLGFFRKNFFVFNESKNFNMMSINCGGGHRRWGFSAEDAKLNKSGFAFIRKEALFAYLRDTSDHNNQFGDSILQNNYHGREVRAIRLIPMSHRGSGDTSIVFATGGEDTILRLQQYLPGSPSTYHTLLTIRKHTTVIKNIDYSQGISTLLFTSGGLEELRCWKLETSSPNTSDGAISVNCLELATCPRLSEDIETRIMDTTVLVYDALKGLHIIGAVYSDGVIRFWLFDESTRQFSLLVESQWHTKCILQISHIILGHRILFFTSATDGRVAIWDIDNELALAIKQQKPKMVQEPIQYYYCHMSGVNALEVILYRGDNQLLIFTGGDDNAISATQITLKDDTVMIGKPFIIPSAHASSVTGIKYMDNSLFTISTDQRLNRWKLKEANNNDLALVLSNSVYMDVPDPSSIDAVISKNKVIVAITGVGLQSVQYDRNT